MQRAGFWIRLGAAAIDAVALYGLQFVGSAISFGFFFAARGGPPSPIYPLLYGMLAVAAVLWAGFVLTEVLGRASPGKWLLGLRIAADSHAAASVGQRLGRATLKYAPLPLYLAAAATTYRMLEVRQPGPGGPPAALIVTNVLFMLIALGVVGGFFAALGSRRQALHDLVAGTVVLRRGEATRGFEPLPAQPVVPAEDAAR